MPDNKGIAKNAGDIYRHIYHNRASSRSKIAADLGISLPTVSHSLELLQEMGLIYNAGEFESTGGRRANMISFVPGARYAIGIDITKSYLVFVLADLDLNLLDNEKLLIPYENADRYYSMISDQIEQMLERNHIAEDRFLGVGISLPVIVDISQNLVTYAEVINLPGNFYEELKRWIRHPFLLFNDANSAGWAELWKREDDNPIVYLSISNSVGGAIVLNKRVYTGSNFRSGEFGHMTIIPHGKRCYCGRYGCLDAYCSALVLSSFTHGDIKEFFSQLKLGENAGYRQIFQQYLHYLAIGINNLRMCFDCDIVLGGNVGALMEDYIMELREITRRLTPFENSADYIKMCSFRTEPSAAGAALYFIDEFVRHF